VIDVTKMVRHMIEDPSSNHGFMTLLRDEDYYRRLTFASSDFEDPSLYPELVVHYTLRRTPRTRGM
jgi:hypothetical protein